jgi:hypothetical protein
MTVPRKPARRAGQRSGVTSRIAVVVIPYAAVAITHEVVHWDAGNPWWLLCLSSITGVACGLVSHESTHQEGRSTGSNWPLLLIMLTGVQLVVIFIGCMFVGYGGRGLATGKIRVGGRAGSRGTYSGRGARTTAVVVMLLGGAAAAWALVGEPLLRTNTTRAPCSGLAPCSGSVDLTEHR